MVISADVLSQWQQQAIDKSWRGVVFFYGNWQSPKIRSGLSIQLSQLHSIQRAISVSNDAAISPFSSSFFESLPFSISSQSFSQSKTLLGQECDLLLLTIETPCAFDALGQLCGTVKAGGMCVFLLPEADDWKRQQKKSNSTYWWQHQVEHWKRQSSSQWLECDFKSMLYYEKLGFCSNNLDSECAEYADIEHDVIQEAKAFPLLRSACVTQDQFRAVLAIKKVAIGHRRRPCVIEADRGRGKSASLGIAAADLIVNHSKQNLWVCAYNKRAAEQVFNYCFHHLASLDASADTVLQGEVTTHLIVPSFNAELRFFAPDMVLTALESHIPDILFIDEAAALPLPLLCEIVKRANRVVFATTIHGYEGTGRSFELRFKPSIQALTLGFQSVYLNQPARWNLNDPLESLIADILLLNSAVSTVNSFLTENLTFVCLKNNELIEEPELFQQSFELLVLAHYKTSPSDLQQLLDNPNISLFVYYSIYGNKKTVVACCLVMFEGELDPDLAEPIRLGRRRLKGHLLPQSLAQYCQQPQTIDWRFARIVRIAVQPEVQGKGIGSKLLSMVCESECLRNVDFVGSSFGATEPLVNFWRQQGFTMCRLGTKRDSISGEYSAIVLLAKTQRASSLQSVLTRRFYEQTKRQASALYADLPASLLCRLLCCYSQNETEKRPLNLITEHIALSSTNSSLELTKYSVAHLILQGADIDSLLIELSVLLDELLLDQESSEAVLCEALIVRVLQGRHWVEYAERFKLSGKKAAQQHFRQSFCGLINGEINV